MTFICKHCGKTFKRDLRLKLNKMFMTKRGYRSVCLKTEKVTYCKPIK